MDNRNLEKAIDIYAKLMLGEEIRRGHGANKDLFEDYLQNAEVYDILQLMMKKLNLHIYEYQDSLHMCAGEGNRVFGYTNEDLKRQLGLKYNKELYLSFFIIYQMILTFYTDTGSYQFVEYVTLPQIVERVTKALKKTISGLGILVENEVEENSFKELALVWDELPMYSTEETEEVRASRASRTAMVKLVFNFMISQELFIEMEERYYPTDRMKAFVVNYFEEYRGRLYELLREDKKNAADE